MFLIPETLCQRIDAIFVVHRSRTTHTSEDQQYDLFAFEVRQRVLLAVGARKIRPVGRSIADAQHVTSLGQALSGVRPDKLAEPDHAVQQGMSGYLLPFEIASVHLLVVLIGAGYLARAKKRMSSSKA